MHILCKRQNFWPFSASPPPHMIFSERLGTFILARLTCLNIGAQTPPDWRPWKLGRRKQNYRHYYPRSRCIKIVCCGCRVHRMDRRDTHTSPLQRSTATVRLHWRYLSSSLFSWFRRLDGRQTDRQTDSGGTTQRNSRRTHRTRMSPRLRLMSTYVHQAHRPSHSRRPDTPDILDARIRHPNFV